MVLLAVVTACFTKLSCQTALASPQLAEHLGERGGDVFTLLEVREMCPLAADKCLSFNTAHSLPVHTKEWAVLISLYQIKAAVHPFLPVGEEKQTEVWGWGRDPISTQNLWMEAVTHAFAHALLHIKMHIFSLFVKTNNTAAQAFSDEVLQSTPVLYHLQVTGWPMMKIPSFCLVVFLC